MTPLPSYTEPRARDQRAAARIRRLHHALLIGVTLAGGLFLGHTSLKAALNLTADPHQIEQGAGW